MRLSLVRMAGSAATGILLLSLSQPVLAQSPLFDAIRRGDAVAVKTLVAAGADVKSVDETGATPLMYAALYAGPDSLQLLIDKGAPVNALNKYGATALMWAATRTPNMTLLLSRGADVNARASDGSTALVVATRFGNADAMRLLLAAGADTQSLETRTNLITGAYSQHDPIARDVLKRAGLVPLSSSDFKGPALGRQLSNDVERGLAVRMIEAGADPYEELPLITLSLPTFFAAARAGQLDAMRSFVEYGYDPKTVGPRGWTALMLAAGGDTPSVPAMRFLLEAGVDINAADEDGRTALDWAMTRGETDTVAFLRRAGGVAKAQPSAAPAAIATPRSTRMAIERALAQIQPVGPKFSDRTKCNSCHNNNIPGIAAALGKTRGLALNQALVPHSMTVTEQAWRNRREAVLLGDVFGGGFQANISYGLLEMAEARLAPTLASDAMVIGLATKQKADGSWPEGVDIRPPLTLSTMAATALAVRALHEFAPRGRQDEMNARVIRGRAYLLEAVAADPQEAMFRLLGLVWSSAPAAEVLQARQQLSQLQRADGGWAQLDTLSSDAYATGLAMYALHAAGVKATDAVYQKGVNYLLRTQLEDGSWFVRTRAFGFQPYLETGFPHGRSQFISTVGTSWAAIALSYTLDAPASATRQ